MKIKQQNEKRSVLVIGDTGFVGTHLTAALIRQKYHVIGFSKKNKHDICRPDDFKSLPKVDCIFHLAAQINSGNVFETNFIGTTNVLEYARHYNTPVIFMSSYLYGQPDYTPTGENHFLRPANTYAFSKYLAEELCRFYSDQYHVSILSLRCFNIYGPGNSTSIISSMVRELKQSNQISISDPELKRDFVFVSDVVDACIKAAEKNANGFAEYNIASGNTWSMKQIAQKVIEISRKKNAPIVFQNETKYNPVRTTCGDNSKAARELGWQPDISIDEGLRMTYDAW